MIELKTYSLTELRKTLSISQKQWNSRKNELLEHLKTYFDYEIVKEGRCYNFIIYEQFAEYEPLPRKNKKPEIIQFYREQVVQEVQEQPWNTGSNIARNIQHKGHNQYEHKVDTMANYIRPIIKEVYITPGTISQWMRTADDRLSYIPLTVGQLLFLHGLYQNNNMSEETAQIVADYKAHYITKREAQEALFDISEKHYTTVMSRFKNEFGFIPVHIKNLQSGASAF